MDKKEQELVEFVASQRHNNKIKTGWDGTKTVNENSVVDLNIVEFGAENIFCRELNLCPDSKIHNTSKKQCTDNHDAI